MMGVELRTFCLWVRAFMAIFTFVGFRPPENYYIASDSMTASRLETFREKAEISV